MPGWTASILVSVCSSACLARRVIAVIVRPWNCAQQCPGADAFEHVAMRERGRDDAATDETGAQLANEGFDFREFGHRRSRIKRIKMIKRIKKINEILS